LALGMWPETATSNEDSWQASLDKVEREGLSVDRKSFHALLWLQYAYLQMGRFDDARRLLTIMEDDHRESSTKGARNHLAQMRAHYLVETKRWSEEIDAPDLDGLDLTPVAHVLLMDGMAALERGDIEAAESHHAELRKRRQDTIAKATEMQPDDGYAPSVELRTLEGQIMELQLSGLIHLAREQTEAGLEQLAQAAELEATAPFGFGPPVPTKPALELYGEALLELGRAPEAHQQLQRSLARNPRRTLSLDALARAAEAAGDAELLTPTAAMLHEAAGSAPASSAPSAQVCHQSK
ncbi:MAG: hypothetical protein AAF560_24575, partial [Acidobacteriota bacterium]